MIVHEKYDYLTSIGLAQNLINFSQNLVVSGKNWLVLVWIWWHLVRIYQSN